MSKKEMKEKEEENSGKTIEYKNIMYTKEDVEEEKRIQNPTKKPAPFVDCYRCCAERLG